MRFALSLGNAGACGDPRTLADFAALAEGCGWDAVFLEDYLVYQNRAGMPTYDPWVSLAAIAMRTQRVRLGTMVTPLPRRRPWKLAAETVALDHLSGGRLILGIGLGDAWDISLRGFDEATDVGRRSAMADEALDVLVGLWHGEPFSYAGRHYRVESVGLQPPPLQRPRIPIWVGGRYPNRGAVRRAARWDGAVLFKAASYSETSNEPAEWTPEDIRQLLAQVNRPGAFDVVVGGRERNPDTAAEVELIRCLAEAGATWWTEWVAPADAASMRAAIARGPLRLT